MWIALLMPYADFSTLMNDIDQIKILCPEHISQYPFIEPNKSKSQFYEKYIDSIEINLNEKINLNESCKRMLIDLGYKRYSVYHYSKQNEFTHVYGRNQIKGGKWIGFGSRAYTYMNGSILVNSSIVDYVQGNYAHKSIELNFSERFMWELSYLFRKFPLSKNEIEKKYGYVIMPYLDNIIYKLKKHEYIDSETEISLTWKGIIHLNHVEKIIMDLVGRNVCSN